MWYNFVERNPSLQKKKIGYQVGGGKMPLPKEWGRLVNKHFFHKICQNVFASDADRSCQEISNLPKIKMDEVKQVLLISCE